MAFVRLKGLNRVKKRLKNGREVVHWYAWKGGPKLTGTAGSPEFIAAFNAAVAARRAPKHDNLASLVARYRASPEFTGLAKSTQAEWRRWLDRIEADKEDLDIGGLPVSALDDRRVKEELLAWRDQWASRRRAADYAMQVLSRVLSWAGKRGILALNAAEGVEQLYSSDRGDLIWEPQHLAAYTGKAKSPEVGYIPRLACATGLRREDMVDLRWSNVGELAIVKATGKSRKGADGRSRKDAVIPLLTDTKALLKEIREQQLARWKGLCVVAVKKGRPEPILCDRVLSNTRGRGWTVDGLEHQVIDTKAAAGLAELHLHDCRGTFATRLRKAGLTSPEIADVLGWEEERVERLLATYVDRDSIVIALAERINRNETAPKTPN